MPYRVEKNSSGKFCVVKTTDRKVMGCHDTHKKASAQMRALYRSERNSPPKKVKADATITQTIESPPVPYAPVRFYFNEGERMVDGRVLNPQSVQHKRQPPFPIMFQNVNAPEHQGAVLGGVITKVMRDGLTHIADGFLDTGSEAGREALRLATPGPNGEPPILQTFSPDLADVIADIEINAQDEDGSDPRDEELHIVEGTFIGLTIVPFPALDSATFEILDEQGNVVVAAPRRENDAVDISADGSNSTTTTTGNVMVTYTTITTPVTDELGNEVGRKSLIACAPDNLPSPEFFTDPQLTELQRYVTLTADGRFYTHVAGRDECHIGFLDRCVTIDMIADCRGEGNFEYAYVGEMPLSDGTTIPVAPIPLKGGHADKSLSAQAALAHYDDPSSVVFYVRYGMDDFGIWASGCIAPLATPEMVLTARASGVSLDARQIDGELRYLAACCVNTPGFPKVALRLAASAADDTDPDILTLVAAGGPPLPPCDECERARIDAELESLTTRLLDNLSASL